MTTTHGAPVPSERTGLVRRAVADAPGPPEALVVRSVPAPVPGPGQVLVAVEAAGVASGDVMARQGTLPATFPTPPATTSSAA